VISLKSSERDFKVFTDTGDDFYDFFLFYIFFLKQHNHSRLKIYIDFL
jgi:hypothetical protein